MSVNVEAAFGYLDKALSGGRLAHAYLIVGPAGSGKSELAARLVARLNGGQVKDSLNALADDHVRLVQPESRSRRITVGQVRKLEGMLHQRAAAGKTKVGIVADADRLGEQAENAFLKTLEEPPDGCLLLLLTAYPEQLLDTILSRCITVTLRAPRGEMPGGEDGVRLREMLARAGAGSGVSEALGMARGFSDLLAGVKAGAEKDEDAAYKEEKAAYGKTTDGRWVKGREDYHKAMAQSRYLGRRAELLEILVAWFGDALRQQSGYGRLDLGADAVATAELARTLSAAELQRRMAVVESLRSDLATNVQEALAVEVAFLEAFAGATG